MSFDSSSFEIGMGVVHPVHGAGVIKNIEEMRVPGGKIRKYLQVSLFQKGLTIKIPAEGELAIRHLANDHHLEECLRVLKSPPTALKQRWNRDHSENLKKIKSGDLSLVAEVARDLLARHNDDHSRLSILDQKLLSDVCEQIRGEVECYMGIRGEKKAKIESNMQDVCEKIMEMIDFS
ncbi:hypothetical protein CL643_03680 [bacterium]|nr:hypothetical protein [bacterium]MBT02188.1 hypothetical protein [bacterium]|tara:strand:- start:7913 stop:8446 length:534 start_codon:yes stop_codon:yes gene_type:complete